MSSRVYAHIRTNVVGYIAIFLFAIGGSAYAVDGPLRGADKVGSADIINGEVYSEDVADDDTANALTGIDVASNSLTGADVTGIGGSDVTDGSLTGVDVLNASLTGTDIQNNSINTEDVFGLRGFDDIEDGSLASADIQDGSLLGSDIATNTLGSEDVRQEGLRGEDIDEGTLNFGCRNGMVKGFARIKGSSNIPSSSYSTSTSHIDRTYNCGGGPVEVSRGNGGTNYTVHFLGLCNPLGAVASASRDADDQSEDAWTSDRDNFVAATVDPEGCGHGVQLQAFDDDGGDEQSFIFVVVY